MRPLFIGLAVITVLITALLAWPTKSELPPFSTSISSPLRVVIFDQAGSDMTDSVFQALAARTHGSLFPSAVEADNVLGADVAIYFLPNWDNSEDWPAAGFLRPVFDDLARVPESTPTANIRIEIDSERQLGLIFVNLAVVPEASPDCIAEFANDVVTDGFEVSDHSIWECTIGR